MRSVMWCAAVAAVVAGVAGVARADDVRVAVAPLTTLGSESSSKEVSKLQAAVMKSISRVAGYSAIPGREMAAAVKKAGKPELRTCEGDPSCLAELGVVVKAQLTVYGEVGGLGDAKVIYLKLVDVEKKREVRSTTLELAGGAAIDELAYASAVRLLAPKNFTGKVVIEMKTKGATIYVDGRKRATSPVMEPLVLSVGAHALRVTHPEFRDFVRFVEVGFDATETVPVKMQRYGVVASEVTKTERDKVYVNGPGGVEPTPWYRKWYTIAGIGVVTAVASALVIGYLADGIDFDEETIVE